MEPQERELLQKIRRHLYGENGHHKGHFDDYAEFKRTLIECQNRQDRNLEEILERLGNIEEDKEKRDDDLADERAARIKNRQTVLRAAWLLVSGLFLLVAGALVERLL